MSITLNSKFLLKVVVVIVFFVVLLLGYISGKSRDLEQLQQKLELKKQMIELQLEAELNQFLNLGVVYSKNKSLIQFLSNANPDHKPDPINHKLEEIAQASHASVLYVINKDGLVVGASNWRQSDNFLNQNFSFRDYFSQALHQGIGFELAVGVVSGKRGVYFSQVIKNQGQIIGVLVIKVNIANMEQQKNLFFLDQNFNFMIENKQQVIFLSNQKQWRLKQLSIDRLTSTPQSLNISRSKFWQHLGFELWQFNDGIVNDQQLVYQQTFEQLPWRFTMLASDRHSSNQGLLVALIFGMSYFALVSILLYYRERRKNIKRLQLSHQKLSHQVMVRTLDLTQANKQLTSEIEYRKSVEADLTTTHQQLIQAAKLATIGELSSSINHELNQPIAALSSYLQTTEKMLNKGMIEQSIANISLMHQLIERLSNIVAQFRNFSRKTRPSLSIVDVSQSINNALAIVNHHIEQQGVTIHFVKPSIIGSVEVESSQLEQVLINLFTNAVDALTNHPDKHIWITIRMTDQVEIEIMDNGAGIEAHYLNQVFEPFFTTKLNTGLGLGLSISMRIIQSFNGELTVDNDPVYGAVFTIKLPKL